MEEFGTIYMGHDGSFQKVVVNHCCLLQLLEGLIITHIVINNLVLAESKQETGSLFLYFCWCQRFSCKYPKLALHCLSQNILTLLQPVAGTILSQIYGVILFK